MIRQINTDTFTVERLAMGDDNMGELISVLVGVELYVLQANRCIHRCPGSHVRALHVYDNTHDVISVSALTTNTIRVSQPALPFFLLNMKGDNRECSE